MSGTRAPLCCYLLGRTNYKGRRDRDAVGVPTMADQFTGHGSKYGPWAENMPSKFVLHIGIGKRKSRTQRQWSIV